MQFGNVLSFVAGKRKNVFDMLEQDEDMAASKASNLSVEGSVSMTGSHNGKMLAESSVVQPSSHSHHNAVPR